MHGVDVKSMPQMQQNQVAYLLDLAKIVPSLTIKHAHKTDVYFDGTPLKHPSTGELLHGGKTGSVVVTYHIDFTTMTITGGKVWTKPDGTVITGGDEKWLGLKNVTSIFTDAVAAMFPDYSKYPESHKFLDKTIGKLTLTFPDGTQEELK